MDFKYIGFTIIAILLFLIIFNYIIEIQNSKHKDLKIASLEDKCTKMKDDHREKLDKESRARHKLNNQKNELETDNADMQSQIKDLQQRNRELELKQNRLQIPKSYNYVPKQIKKKEIIIIDSESENKSESESEFKSESESEFEINYNTNKVRKRKRLNYNPNRKKRKFYPGSGSKGSKDIATSIRNNEKINYNNAIDQYVREEGDIGYGETQRREDQKNERNDKNLKEKEYLNKRDNPELYGFDPDYDHITNEPFIVGDNVID